MKILIYGAGVTGCTYGWQLSQAGCDVTVLVREGKKKAIDENGINIHCSDFRGGQKKVEQIVFRPHVIERLSADNDYEYIIVSVNNTHLAEVLPVLPKSSGKANILFFQNNWDSFDTIAQYLSPEQYFFGFPFMVGGGRDENQINSVISGMQYSSTPLGEANGEISPRVQKIAKALEAANLKPLVSKQILVWLVTHYAVAAGLSAGIMQAGGSMTRFTANSHIIRQTIKAIREGFAICAKRGFDPKLEKANKLYNLPLFIGVAIAKKIYSNEALGLMFEGHLKHASAEMKKMLDDVTVYGEDIYGLDIPHLKNFRDALRS